MLKHIVMWKLKNENRESNAEKIKDILENLKRYRRYCRDKSLH